MPAALDLATRKIVGWGCADHSRTEPPLAASMTTAQRQRSAEGLICHSDRSRYASATYGQATHRDDAKPAMSRTACRYDNAPM